MTTCAYAQEVDGSGNFRWYCACGKRGYWTPRRAGTAARWRRHRYKQVRNPWLTCLNRAAYIDAV